MLEISWVWALLSSFPLCNCQFSWHYSSLFPCRVEACCCPPGFIFFLWLLSYNKLLTRGNLSKRIKIDGDSCLFCCEHETVSHLFFDCVVAKVIRKKISGLFKNNVGMNLESKFWIYAGYLEEGHCSVKEMEVAVPRFKFAPDGSVHFGSREKDLEALGDAMEDMMLTSKEESLGATTTLAWMERFT